MSAAQVDKPAYDESKLRAPMSAGERFHIRQRYELSDRQWRLLQALNASGPAWRRPMDISSETGRSVTNDLQRLCTLGLVDFVKRSPNNPRSNLVYRINTVGRVALKSNQRVIGTASYSPDVQRVCLALYRSGGWLSVLSDGKGSLWMPKVERGKRIRRETMQSLIARGLCQRSTTDTEDRYELTEVGRAAMRQLLATGDDDAGPEESF